MVTQERLKDMPQSPGVYLMKGNKGEVLYIGKAKNIRNRVRSYFQETSDTRHTIKFLAAKIHDIEYLITTNEKEAIILEDTLLKKYKPRYNIRLKDDKTYVSIKLTLAEKFPRILIIRQIKPVPAGLPSNVSIGGSKQGKDGSHSQLKPAPACFKRGDCVDKYFGPYASAQKARETVRFIRNLFLLRTCSQSEFRNRVRACLDYQLGICSAPCVRFISETGYKELIDKTIMFLEGKSRELLSELKADMIEAANIMAFEKAAKIRNQINAIEATLEEQKVVSQEKIDRDIFAHIMFEGGMLIQAMFIREGRLGGARDFFFNSKEFPQNGSVLPVHGQRQSFWLEEAVSSFLAQYYSGDRFIPDEIIASVALEDKDAIENWLSENKGKKVRLFFPSKGNKLKFLNMAEVNAKEALKKRVAVAEKEQTLLQELQKRLHLRKKPEIIEAFDISNISGKMAVGAMVVFEDGKPNKDKYRLYKIRTLEEPDDYGMLYEVLSRRYKVAANAQAPSEVSKGALLPDLILIDGGKGQLNIAIKVINELGIKGIDIAAIAKEKEQGLPPHVSIKESGGGSQKAQGEKIYLPNVKDPVILRQGSAPDLFVRKIRDDVHRFAIGYHKKLRGKIKSLLDEIPGIGKAKRNSLLKHFESIEKIKQASAEEIAKVPGITATLAEAIKMTLGESHWNIQ
ncbi:MAG: excinuclease ABC subunit UvrC [Deltaproteobacteria bacterium]|nr:excinuclease ABC subunit UvrC [Deltaproteobacteria bacterium]